MSLVSYNKTFLFYKLIELARELFTIIKLNNFI